MARNGQIRKEDPVQIHIVENALVSVQSPSSPFLMDSLSFDGYTSYSDASTPRTPSPTDQPPYPTHPKAAFNDQWPKGSLLQELYNESDSEYPQSNSWDTTAQAVNLMRRSTFPYIRHDREDVQHYHTPYGIQQQQHPVFQQHQQLNSYRHDFNPYNDFDEHHSIKLEESSIMVPSQHSYYTPPGSSAGPASISIPPGPSHNAIYIPSQSQNHSSSPSLLHPHVPSHSFPHPNPHPHAGLVVQHTDDAASKETQYLRRRCFNCHTTEPPSWRRSTLNPGKIVCNKCGLYERTHLRPRPLRFDELRTGGKARKMGIPKPHGSIDASAPGTLSPKHAKRVRGGLVRQSSVSSNSSVHSSSGASDWDDSGMLIFLKKPYFHFINYFKSQSTLQAVRQRHSIPLCAIIFRLFEIRIPNRLRLVPYLP